jgi:hypothetical protein
MRSVLLPIAGMSGFDVYVYDPDTSHWRWLATACPTYPSTVLEVDVHNVTHNGALEVRRFATRTYSQAQSRDAPTRALALSHSHPQSRSHSCQRRFRIHLPTYNGIKSLRIGIYESPAESLRPDPDFQQLAPIVWYGTSILQVGRRWPLTRQSFPWQVKPTPALPHPQPRVP